MQLLSSVFISIALLALLIAADTSASSHHVYQCNGPNFSNWCLNVGDEIGVCFTWMATWTWIQSFKPDPGMSCTIYDNVVCTGNTYGPIKSPGIADFAAIGWLDRMESFRCTFAYEPVAGVGRVRLPPSNATAYYPLYTPSTIVVPPVTFTSAASAVSGVSSNMTAPAGAYNRTARRS